MNPVIKLIGESLLDGSWKLKYVDCIKNHVEVWSQADHGWINVVNRQSGEMLENRSTDLLEVLKELIL